MIYVITAVSESGDHYGPYLVQRKPLDSQLEAFFRDEVPGEFEDGPGPGDWGSYLYVTVVPRFIMANLDQPIPRVE